MSFHYSLKRSSASWPLVRLSDEHDLEWPLTNKFSYNRIYLQHVRKLQREMQNLKDWRNKQSDVSTETLADYETKFKNLEDRIAKQECPLYTLMSDPLYMMHLIWINHIVIITSCLKWNIWGWMQYSTMGVNYRVPIKFKKDTKGDLITRLVYGYKGRSRRPR